MKKFFSLFAAVLFAGSMMAAETVYKQTIFNATNNSGKISSYENSWTNTTDGFTVNIVNANNNNNGWAYIKMGRKNVTSVGSIATAAAVDKAITKVALTIDAVTASKINSLKLYISADGSAWSEEGAFTVAAGAQEVAIAEAKQAVNLYYKVEADCASGSSNGLITISKVEFYAEEGGDPTPVIEYYVVGSMNNWELSADYKLAANPAQAGEYMKRFTFAANDELKVRKAIDGELDAWYPEGVGNNWVITEDGQYDVYFRPEGNTEWANGFFFVAPYVIPQYEVAEAIAAGLTDGTEIKVRGVVSKIEFKGTNFKTFGSANIYVNDATGAEGSFEFYNCYSMNADTFKVSVPAWDATSTSYAQFTEVSDANGYTIHVGDTVIAQGKYLYYAKNSVHELNTGCFIIYAKAPDAEFPTAIDNTNIDAKVVKFFENGQLIIIKNGVRYNAQGAVVR